MGEPAQPTDKQRTATRELAARIVESVIADERMPLDMHTTPSGMVTRFGVEELVMQLAQEIVELNRERDEAQFKLSTLAEQYTAAEAELRTAKAALATVHAGPDFVWFWQGDGGNHIESLSCPVVMDAETLKAIIAARDEACAIAARLHAHKCPSYETGNECAFKADIERLAELRKVGTP